MKPVFLRTSVKVRTVINVFSCLCDLTLRRARFQPGVILEGLIFLMNGGINQEWFCWNEWWGKGKSNQLTEITLHLFTSSLTLDSKCVLKRKQYRLGTCFWSQCTDLLWAFRNASVWSQNKKLSLKLKTSWKLCNLWYTIIKSKIDIFNEANVKKILCRWALKNVNE